MAVPVDNGWKIQIASYNLPYNVNHTYISCQNHTHKKKKTHVCSIPHDGDVAN